MFQGSIAFVRLEFLGLMRGGGTCLDHRVDHVGLDLDVNFTCLGFRIYRCGAQWELRASIIGVRPSGLVWRDVVLGFRVWGLPGI